MFLKDYKENEQFESENILDTIIAGLEFGLYILVIPIILLSTIFGILFA